TTFAGRGGRGRAPACRCRCIACSSLSLKGAGGCKEPPMSAPGDVACPLSRDRARGAGCWPLLRARADSNRVSPALALPCDPESHVQLLGLLPPWCTPSRRLSAASCAPSVDERAQPVRRLQCDVELASLAR